MTVVLDADASAAGDPSSGSPTVARRMLLHQLNVLVAASGRTNSDLGRAMGINGGTLGRWLAGEKQNLRAADVRPLLAALGHGEDDPVSRSLVQLVNAARQRGIAQNRRPWMEKFRFDQFAGLEQGAVNLTDVEALIVPGLLQTRRYAEAALRAVEPGISTAELRERVEMRMRRQEVLRRAKPPHLVAIIDEAVFWRRPADASVMREQLEYLRAMAHMPSVEVRVVPFSAGLTVGGEAGSFVLLEFADDVPPIAYSETPAQALYVEDEAGISRYRDVIAQLTQCAATGEAAVDMMTAAIECL